MKIPKSISASAAESYQPSEYCLNLAGEKGRRIHAWNGDLPDNGLPRLADLAVYILPASAIHRLPPQCCQAKQLLTETITVKIPLSEAAKEIPDGDYWERRFHEEGPNDIGDVEAADGSWKRLFMEKFAQEEIENMDLKGENLYEIIDDIIKTAGDDVHVLKIGQLQTNMDDDNKRIDLVPFIIGFTNLTELHLRFGVNNIGSNYEKSYFEVTEWDCRNIGNGVAQAKNLRLLRIHHSLLEDPKIMLLLKNMHGNKSLKILDFSHCHLRDEGASAIADFSNTLNTMESLILTNNRIAAEGAIALASKVTRNLKNLNLRFNPIGDKGAIALLTSGPAFHTLNLACCQLGEPIGLALNEILCTNGSLEELDISNNNLGKSAGATLKGLSHKTLQYLDLRMTQIEPQDQIAIEQCLSRNRTEKRKTELMTTSITC